MYNNKNIWGKGKILGKEVFYMNCPFCDIEEFVFENELCYAVYDKYPVTKGHMLIITKRHVADYFQMTEEELKAALDLVDDCKNYLDEEFSPDAYNIGSNAGLEAGQTIMHLHIHLIPRYSGDIEDPTGGVRGVIPERQKY